MNNAVFSPKQAELMALFKHGQLRRINLLEGSVRSGKTWISLVLWAFWVATMPKEGAYLMAAKSLTTLRRNCLDLLAELVGVSNFTYSLPRKEGRLFGRRIYLEGVNDVRAEAKIRGMTLQGAYCDELTLFTEDFFSMLLSRLSLPGAKVIATTNPDNPNHWLMEHYINRRDELDMLDLRFLIDDNPFLDPAYVAALKQEYTGAFYDRFIRGVWRAAEGLCYQQFADEPERFLVEKPQEDVQFITIGVDFGGSRSLTTFVATAVHRGYRCLTALMDYHIAGRKGEIDSDRVNREFIAFAKRVQAAYPAAYVRYAFADSEAQYLINGLARACRGALPGLSVQDCKKTAILERIACANTLFNTGRLFVCRECRLLMEGLRMASWDTTKAKDTRLDNFSSDIDILDAFEYSWERFLPKLLPDRRRNEHH